MAKLRPARGELRAWLESTGTSQSKLGAALGVTQQTISAALNGRPLTEELAKLIQEATGVRWTGWFTPAQLRRREEKRRLRVSRARALRSAA